MAIQIIQTSKQYEKKIQKEQIKKEQNEKKKTQSLIESGVCPHCGNTRDITKPFISTYSSANSFGNATLLNTEDITVYLIEDYTTGNLSFRCRCNECNTIWLTTVWKGIQNGYYKR